jgi:hypothetical protein
MAMGFAPGKKLTIAYCNAQKRILTFLSNTIFKINTLYYTLNKVILQEIYCPFD